MKFNFFLPKKLKHYYTRELALYKSASSQNQFHRAWQHLERAHIIGQSYPMAHSYAHWCMLRFGFRIKNWREVAGQIPRLLVGGVKSFVGKIPVGNSGRAHVPPLRSMPIPADIQIIFDKPK